MVWWEPLVNKGAIYNLSESFLNTCRQYAKPYNVAITTNGYLLYVSTFQQLLDFQVYTYCIAAFSYKIYSHDIFTRLN